MIILHTMGTNFYLRERIDKQKKEYLKTLIEDEKWEDVKDTIPQEIHIGKRSSGWKFLWDCHRFNYYKPNKESLIEWLHSGGIYDEYGTKFTIDQFLNGEISLEGYDLESYYRDNPHQYTYYYDPINLKYFEEITGIIPNRLGEFYIDDYRFTISEDFS